MAYFTYVMVHIKLNLIAALAILATASVASLAIPHRVTNTGPIWKPQTISPSPTSIGAGQSVTLTASSDSAATDDTTVNIAATGSRLSYPATVTIPSGASSVSFTVTASSSGSTESDTVAASTATGSASGVVNVTSR